MEIPHVGTLMVRKNVIGVNFHQHLKDDTKVGSAHHHSSPDRTDEVQPKAAQAPEQLSPDEAQPEPPERED
jgi:hypothetical protein